MTTRRIHPLLLIPALLLPAAIARAQPPAGWDCRFCPDVAAQDSGTIELGLGTASDTPLRFAPVQDGPTLSTGAGALGWLGVQYAHPQGNGSELRLQVDRLGLDNPAVSLSGRNPGHYDLQLSYQELQRPAQSAGQTPFRGEYDLTLPDDWVRGSSTAGMSALPAGLHDYGSTLQRRRLGFDAQVPLRSRWTTHARYRRDERSGRDWQSASVLTQATLLPAPVDHTTDSLDLSAEYAAQVWRAQLGYGLSLFRNGATALRWDNPYTAIAAGADRGELALAPDNQAQLLSLSGQYFGLARLSLNGSIAAGRMEQDEELLPASANPELAVALPRHSARARIDMLSGMLRASYRAGRRSRWQLQYRYADRDNRTPQDEFVQVRTDAFIAEARRNLPYSFTDQELALRADYRLSRALRLRFGLEQEQRDRPRQTRRHTDESRAWTSLRLQSKGATSLTARLGFSRRDGSAFEPLADDAPPLNAHQRAFNLADRDRLDSRLNLNTQLGPQLQMDLQAELSDENYADSAVGLQNARNNSIGLSLSGTPLENLQWQIWANRGESRLEQAGSAAPDIANWWGDSHDRIDSCGLNLDRTALLPKVDLNLRYEFSTAHGRVRVASADFPELQTRLHGLQLDTVWHWRPRVDWTLRYRYERYRDADWQRDGLAADTLPNLLAGGERGYNDVAHLVSVSARYRF